MIESTNWIQVPDKFVFLDHNTHSTILRIAASPLEVYATSDAGFNGNYTSVGYPTVSIDGRASNFSSTSYIYMAPQINSNATTFELNTRITVGSNITDPQAMFGSESKNAQLFKIINGKLGFYTSYSGDVCNFNVTANAVLWVKGVLSASSYIVYAYPYTAGSTPPVDLSSWTVCGTTTNSNSLDRVRAAFVSNVRIPTNGDPDYSSQYFRGYMWLLDTNLSINSGEVTWTAGTPRYGTYVQASNWTWVNGEVYQFLTPINSRKSISALYSGTYPADLKGYLLMTQGTTQPVLSAVTTDYEVVPYSYPSNSAYTGYSYTVTDTSGTALVSLTKTGTRCRAFEVNSAAGTAYAFIPSSYFTTDTDRTIAANQIRLAYSETHDIPFRQFTVSADSFTYDAATKKITNSSDPSNTYTYKGRDVFIERSDLAT